MPEKVVYDPTQDKIRNPKKKVRTDEPLHANDEGVDEEKPKRTPKINKYGFFHVDKDLAKHLGIEFGKDKADVPVTIERVEGGFVVKIVKA